jgi:hypothetical protein
VSLAPLAVADHPVADGADQLYDEIPDGSDELAVAVKWPAARPRYHAVEPSQYAPLRLLNVSDGVAGALVATLTVTEPWFRLTPKALWVA